MPRPSASGVSLLFTAALLPVLLAQAGSAQAQGKAEQTERGLYRELVGTLSGAHLLHCHETIGLLAEGRSAKAYTDADAQKRLKGLVGLMAAVDGQLAKVAKFEKDRGDKDAMGNTLELMRSIGQSIRTQADELEAFWKTNEQSRLANYQKARQETVKGMQKLGLK